CGAAGRHDRGNAAVQCRRHQRQVQQYQSLRLHMLFHSQQQAVYGVTKTMQEQDVDLLNARGARVWDADMEVVLTKQVANDASISAGQRDHAHVAFVRCMHRFHDVARVPLVEMTSRRSSGWSSIGAFETTHTRSGTESSVPIFEHSDYLFYPAGLAGGLCC